jgi:signal transduction histidine kinase
MIAKSDGFRKNNLNKLYFCCVIVFTLASVLTGLFAEELPNVGAVTYTFFVIAHIVLLSERYSRAISDVEFLNSMSHKLLTPLTKISTNIQVARSRPGEAYELLTKSQEEIMKMAEMINSALDDKRGGNP